eukprot:1157823-Pelagomonas_calceolata.AAC.8
MNKMEHAANLESASAPLHSSATRAAFDEWQKKPGEVHSAEKLPSADHGQSHTTTSLFLLPPPHLLCPTLLISPVP